MFFIIRVTSIGRIGSRCYICFHVINSLGAGVHLLYIRTHAHTDVPHKSDLRNGTHALQPAHA